MVRKHVNAVRLCADTATVILAGIVVDLFFNARYSYDLSDFPHLDFDVASILRGKIAAQVLLAIGFLGKLVWYSFVDTNGTSIIAKGALQTILLLFSLQAWISFPFLLMDLNEDDSDYNNFHDFERTYRSLNKLYIDLGIIVGISFLSYKGMTMEQIGKAARYTLNAALTSLAAFIVLIVLSFQFRIISGTLGSFKGQETIQKALDISTCIASGLSAVLFFAKAVLCFKTRQMDMIFNGYKYVLIGTGLVFTTLGLVYLLHDDFGSTKTLPNSADFFTSGVQTIAIAMVLFALNGSTNMSAGYEKMNKDSSGNYL